MRLAHAACWLLRIARAAGRAVALTLLAAALTGCAGVRSPEFRVTGARLAEETDDGALLVFSLEGDNRNEQALPLRDVRYRVTLGDGAASFATYRLAQATLPPLSVGTFELPTPLSAETAAALTNGQRRYRLRAEVVYFPPGAFPRALFNASIHRPSVAFVQEGRLDFEATPEREPSGAGAGGAR